MAKNASRLSQDLSQPCSISISVHISRSYSHGQASSRWPPASCRPQAGSGPFAEPTKPVRIPVSLVDTVLTFIECRQRYDAQLAEVSRHGCPNFGKACTPTTMSGPAMRGSFSGTHRSTVSTSPHRRRGKNASPHLHAWEQAHQASA